MKKFRILATALLASTMPFALTGCDLFEEPASTTTEATVTKVTISGNDTVGVGSTIKLKATVEGENLKKKDKKVNWRSANSAVATIDEDGTVTGKKVGKTKITATSELDPTKKATLEITVSDTGFDPTFIEDGFTYSENFPVDEIKSFIGSGSYQIVELDNLEGGCYYKKYEAEGGYPASIEVLVDGVRYEEYAYALVDAGFDKVYTTSDGYYEAVDPTGKYTVAMYSSFDEDAYEDVAPTVFDFYLSSDVWDDGTLTSDTSWSESHIAEDNEDYIEVIREYLAVVPFVKMGQNYEISYVDNSYMRAILEMFGYDSSGYPDYFMIYDYTISDSILANYPTTLLNNGYEEYGDYYAYVDGINSYYVDLSFSEGGNTIYVQKAPSILDDWPFNDVDDYVENVIGSKYEVPAYEETAGALYQMALNAETEDTPAYAEIDIDQVTFNEAETYSLLLEEQGFEVIFEEGTDETYPCWIASHGKIGMEIVFYENYDEQTQTYDSENGALAIMIYANEAAHEEDGIYLPESIFAILDDGEFILDLEVVGLDNPTLVVTSSDTSVATVDGLKVTPVEAGTTTITVTVENTEFVATTVLTVSEESYFDIAVKELNDWLNENDVESIELPDLDCTYVFGEYDSDYDCYSIYAETLVSENEYIEAMENAGYAGAFDDYGYYYLYNDDVEISVWNYDDDILEIDVYISSGGGTIIEGDGVTFDFSELTLVNGTIGSFSYTSNKGSNSTPPAYNDNKQELRLYVNNTITITSTGEPITSIYFNANTCGESKADGVLSCDVGEMVEVDDGFYWEGNAISVTFTVSSGKQVHINYIDVKGGGISGGGGTTTGDIEDIVEELSYNLTGEYDAFENYSGDYYLALNWGTTSEYSLTEAVDDASWYLPDVFVYCDEESAYTDTWEDGSEGAFNCFYTSDYSIGCEIGSYIESGKVIVQFCVFDSSSYF